MLSCKKCQGRLFIDRQYTSFNHLEIYCIRCGMRNFFHPPKESKEGLWLLEKELYRAKLTITNL
jgi:hypothetical protein